MGHGFTRDPGVALSGLVSLAFLGVLVVGGGLIASGLIDGSRLQAASGAVLFVGLSAMIFRAGRVVRHGLAEGGAGDSDM